MAKQNRTTLKGYFETGDIPSQAQYADLIDSVFVFEDQGDMQVGNLTASLNISASGDLIVTDITASGNISASGNGIFSKVNTGEGLTEVHLMNQNLRQIDGVVFGSVETTGNTGFGNAITDTHTLEGHKTASHNISSSGTVESNGLILTSPDGTRYQISVNNAGTLSTTAI